MPFVNENINVGLRRRDTFQVGRSNVDPGTDNEEGILLPWPSDPALSWVYYEVAVGAMLDSGIVVHHRLPQVNNAPDTIGLGEIDDPAFDKLTGFGINLRCRDQYTDIVQRMGHARYWFRLWGQALRIGYRVPIPTLKTIGGVPAIPYDKNPQWGYNMMTPGGNYGGVILWRAAWSLWYTTAVPPRDYALPAAELASHIRATSQQPDQIQVPLSEPDNNAVPNRPGQRAPVQPRGGQ